MAVVGIDVGTQSLKAVVCSDRLERLGEASVRYDIDCPRPGWAEQDPRVWEEALAPAVGRALAAAGLAPASVRALGIAGQLDGCVPVGADDRALGPCLIWIDKRASPIDLPAELAALTGLVADPSHMAYKIRWLREHGDRATRYHQPVSYLVARLTGEHVYDRGLASTTMLYDVVAADYDDRLLARFEIERGWLPRIAGASEIAGELYACGAELIGLPAKIPVAVGTGDDFATPLGAGVIAPGAIVCGLGTAEVVGAVSMQPLFDPDTLVETHAYFCDRYFIENPGWPAGGALRWIGAVVGAGFDELDELAARVAPGAGDLIFLPALAGAMAPEWNALARGSFYGLSLAHGPEHLVRAVMEGCIFSTRDVVERLRALGIWADTILLLSGGSRSRVWAQIRADAIGLPVQVARDADTCPVGAAMLAAVAGGVQPDLAGCAELVKPRVITLEPDLSVADRYDDLHRRYRLLFESLRPLYT